MNLNNIAIFITDAKQVKDIKKLISLDLWGLASLRTHGYFPGYILIDSKDSICYICKDHPEAYFFTKYWTDNQNQLRFEPESMSLLNVKYNYKMYTCRGFLRTYKLRRLNAIQ